MLIEINGDIINLDHVKKIEPKLVGDGRKIITFIDGETMGIASFVADRIERLCGTIIKADPGYRLISASDVGDRTVDPLFDETSIIAFRINGDAMYSVLTPITIEGEVHESFDAWAVVTPEGKCYSPDEQFDSVEAFRNTMMKRHEKERAERLERDKATKAAAA
jgi:hypothetical protein